MRKIDRERRKMEKKQAKLCKMIDGISWWLYNGKDRGAVYGHRTGRGLGDCRHVKKFFLSHPVTACDEFIFQKCDHCVATAKGESADFKKHKEKGT